jgi:hypothetical protein
MANGWIPREAIFQFKKFKSFKPINPHLHPPPRRGGGIKERVERLERFERLELFLLVDVHCRATS